MKTIIWFTWIIILLAGCSKAQVRIKNDFRYDLKNVTIGEVEYGKIKESETTDYLDIVFGDHDIKVDGDKVGSVQFKKQTLLYVPKYLVLFHDDNEGSIEIRTE